MKCINCGFEHSGKFCPKCGTKNNGEIRCARCGNVHSGKFCPKCGTYSKNNLEEYPMANQPVVSRPVTPPRPVTPAPGPVPKPEKGSKVLLIIICILSIVVVTGMCGLVLYFTGAFSDNTDDDSNETKYTERDVDIEKEEKRNSQETEKEEREEEEIEEEITEEEEEEPEEFSLNYDADEYLYPTHEKNITKEELDMLTREEVSLVRNEIYARHGYTFSTQSYTDFFNTKDWYDPDPYLTDGAYIEDSLNFYEKTNKDFIVQYEKEMGWR